MPKIFISYKRQDKDKVFPIVDQIRKETGIDCWIDLEGIESGDQFQNVIVDAIDNADIFIFMLSRNFIAPYRDERTGKIDLRKQTFPEKEVMYALRHDKRIVPVSIDGTKVYDCKWLEFNCSGLDCIDWKDESQRCKLLRNLRQWTGKSVANDSTLQITPPKPEPRKSRIAESGVIRKMAVVCAAVLLSGMLIWGLVALFSSSTFIVKDLSSSSSANCYIVSQSGTYKFKPVKGNSSESVGQVASAEVLWETFGTSESPSKGDLIRKVSFSDGFVKFSTADTFREGNALIAARDASGNILWSWHIWLTDQPKGQTYNNGAGVMMDRNLGATSSTKGDVGALGLLYQWGRKDPFLGSLSIIDNIEAESTITWPSPVSSSSSTGTISFATSHPTTFITSDSNNYDWYYTVSSSTDNTRWRSSKTVYDPCPAGWRVPNGGSDGVWSKAFGISSSWGNSSNWDSSNKGMDFSGIDKKLGSSGPIWYPASGYRNSSDGTLSLVGGNGSYWSVSPNGKYAFSLGFNDNGCIDPANYNYRASRRSVRCLQE